MNDSEPFFAGAAGLVEAVNAFAAQYALQGIAAADHIGYKCESKQVFEETRAMLELESTFMYQSYISSRRIAIFKLKQPLQTVLGPISVFELNDQKPDHSQKTWFDHIEVHPTGIAYDALVQKLLEQGAPVEKIERPHHTTYDIRLSNGCTLKLTREPLLSKITRDEMA